MISAAHVARTFRQDPARILLGPQLDQIETLNPRFVAAIRAAAHEVVVKAENDAAAS